MNILPDAMRSSNPHSARTEKNLSIEQPRTSVFDWLRQRELPRKTSVELPIEDVADLPPIPRSLTASSIEVTQDHLPLLPTINRTIDKLSYYEPELEELLQERSRQTEEQKQQLTSIRNRIAEVLIIGLRSFRPDDLMALLSQTNNSREWNLICMLYRHAQDRNRLSCEPHDGEKHR